MDDDMFSDSSLGDPGGGIANRTRSRSENHSGNKENSVDENKSKRVKINHVQVNQSNSQSPIPTSNVFQGLNSDANEHEIINTIVNTSKNHEVSRDSDKLKERVPPITVLNLSISELAKHIQANVSRSVYGDGKIRYKITQHGIKMYVNNIDDFKTIRKLLINSKVHFYSHPLLEEKTIKFVMHGLHEVSEADLKSFFSERGVFASNISKLRINKKRYDDQCIYLLQFSYDQNMSLERLRTIRHVDGVIVKFEKYFFNQSNVTQCANCLRFSHGAKNCNLPPRCIRCGGNHASSLCDKLINPKDPRSKIPASQVSCANCKGNHTANFEKCSERQKYLHVRQNSSSTRQNNSANRQNNSASRQNTRHKAPPATTPRPSRYQSDFEQERPSYRDVTRNSSDLFSPAQMYQIFKKFTNELLKCKTKEEQIDTIAQMTFNLLSNDRP